jgi:hypothetical protein
MNPDKVVFEALSSSGIPGTKVAYQEGHAPPLPFFVYLTRRGGDLFACDTNYAKVQRYRAELYQRENDPELRERFEAAIASLGPYTAYETWIPTEQCLMTSYDFSFDIDRQE